MANMYLYLAILSFVTLGIMGAMQNSSGDIAGMATFYIPNKCIKNGYVMSQDYNCDDNTGTYIFTRCTYIDTIEYTYCKDDACYVKEAPCKTNFCYDGKCTMPEGCYDSDGDNKYTPGYVLLEFDHSKYTAHDKCYGNNVVEYVCKRGMPSYNIEKCRTACMSGSCSR